MIDLKTSTNAKNVTVNALNVKVRARINVNLVLKGMIFLIS